MDVFLNPLSQLLYLNNATNLHRFNRRDTQSGHVDIQHRDRIEIANYCHITPPYVYYSIFSKDMDKSIVSPFFDSRCSVCIGCNNIWGALCEYNELKPLQTLAQTTPDRL